MAQDRSWYRSPWLLLPLVLALGVGLGFLLVNVLEDDPQADDPSQTASATSTPSETPSSPASTAAEGVDGCLGGPDPNQAVVTALDEAPLTDEGLAAAARTVVRWVLQYPIPPNAPEIADQIATDQETAATLIESMTTAAQTLSVSGYVSAKVSPSDSAYKLSATSVTGYEGDLLSVDVLVQRDLVGDGVPDEQQKAVLNIYLQVTDGQWKFWGGDPIPAGTEEDPQQGDFIEYAGSC